MRKLFLLLFLGLLSVTSPAYTASSQTIAMDLSTQENYYSTFTIQHDTVPADNTAFTLEFGNGSTVLYTGTIAFSGSHSLTKESDSSQTTSPTTIPELAHSQSRVTYWVHVSRSKIRIGHGQLGSNVILDYSDTSGTLNSVRSAQLTTTGTFGTAAPVVTTGSFAESDTLNTMITSGSVTAHPFFISLKNFAPNPNAQQVSFDVPGDTECSINIFDQYSVGGATDTTSAGTYTVTAPPGSTQTITVTIKKNSTSTNKWNIDIAGGTSSVSQTITTVTTPPPLIQVGANNVISNIAYTDPNPSTVIDQTTRETSYTRFMSGSNDQYITFNMTKVTGHTPLSIVLATGTEGSESEIAEIMVGLDINKILRCVLHDSSLNAHYQSDARALDSFFTSFASTETLETAVWERSTPGVEETMSDKVRLDLISPTARGITGAVTNPNFGLISSIDQTDKMFVATRYDTNNRLTLIVGRVSPDNNHTIMFAWRAPDADGAALPAPTAVKFRIPEDPFTTQTYDGSISIAGITPAVAIPSGAVPSEALLTGVENSIATSHERMSITEGEQGLIHARTIHAHRFPANDVNQALITSLEVDVAAEAGQQYVSLSLGEPNGNTVIFSTGELSGLTVKPYPLQLIIEVNTMSVLGTLEKQYGTLYLVENGSLIATSPPPSAAGFSTGLQNTGPVWFSYDGSFFSAGVGTIGKARRIETKLDAATVSALETNPLMRIASNLDASISNIAPPAIHQNTASLSYNKGSLSFQSSDLTKDTKIRFIPTELTGVSNVSGDTGITLKGVPASGGTYTYTTEVQLEGRYKDISRFSIPAPKSFTIVTTEKGISVTATDNADNAHQLFALPVPPDFDLSQTRFVEILDQSTDANPAPPASYVSNITTTQAPDLSALTTLLGVTQSPENPEIFAVKGNGGTIYQTGSLNWRDEWQLISGNTISFEVDSTTAEDVLLILNPAEGETVTNPAIRFYLSEGKLIGIYSEKAISTGVNFNSFQWDSVDSLRGKYSITLNPVENTLSMSRDGVAGTPAFFGTGLTVHPTVLKRFSFGTSGEVTISNITNAQYNGQEPTRTLTAEQAQRVLITADINAVGSPKATDTKTVTHQLLSPTGSYQLVTTLTLDVAGNTLTFSTQKKADAETDFTEIHTASITVPTGAAHFLSEWIEGTNTKTWLSFDHGVISLGLGSDPLENAIYSFFDEDALTDLNGIRITTTGTLTSENVVIQDATTRPVIFSARTTTDVPTQPRVIPITPSDEAITDPTRTITAPKIDHSISFNYQVGPDDREATIIIEGDRVTISQYTIQTTSQSFQAPIPADTTELWIAWGPGEQIAVGHGATPSDATCLLQWEGEESVATFQTLAITPAGSVGEGAYNIADLAIGSIENSTMDTYAAQTPSDSVDDTTGALSLSNLNGVILTQADGTWKHVTTSTTPDNINLTWQVAAGADPFHIILGTTNTGRGSVQVTVASDNATVRNIDSSDVPVEIAQTLASLDGSYQLSYIAPVLSLSKDGVEITRQTLTSPPAGMSTLTFSTTRGTLTVSDIEAIERESETFSTTSSPSWISASNGTGSALLEGVLMRETSTESHCLARLQIGNETSTGSGTYTPIFFINLIQSSAGTTAELFQEGQTTALASGADASLSWVPGQRIPFSLMYKASADGTSATISLHIANKELIRHTVTPTSFTHAAIGSFQPETTLGTYSLITFDDVQPYSGTNQLTAYFSHTDGAPFLFWRAAHTLPELRRGTITGSLQYASVSDPELVSDNDRVLIIALGSDNAAAPDAQPYYQLELHTGQGKIILTDDDGTEIISSDIPGFGSDPHPFFKLEDNGPQQFSLTYDNGALHFICGDTIDADNRIEWSTNLVWQGAMTSSSNTINRIGFGYQDSITNAALDRGPRALFSNIAIAPVSGQIHTLPDESFIFSEDAASSTINQLTATAMIQKEASENTAVVFGLGEDASGDADYTVRFSYDETNGANVVLTLPDDTEVGASLAVLSGSAWHTDLNTWSTGDRTPLWFCLYDDTLMLGTGIEAGVNPLWKHTLGASPSESLTHLGLASEDGTVMVTDLSVSNGEQSVETADYTWITTPNSSEYVRMTFTSSAEKEMFIGLQISDDTEVSYEFKVGDFNNNQTQIIRRGDTLESSVKLPGSDISVSILQADLTYQFEFDRGTAKLSYFDSSGTLNTLFHYTDTNFESKFDNGTSVTRLGLRGGIPFSVDSVSFEDAPTSGSHAGPTTLAAATQSNDGSSPNDDSSDGGTATDPIPFELTNITQTNTIVFDFTPSREKVDDDGDPVLDASGNPEYDFYNANVSSHQLPVFEDLAWGLISRPLSVDMGTGFSLTSEFKFTSAEHGRKIAVLGLKSKRPLPDNGNTIRIIHNDANGSPIVFDGCDNAAYVLLIQDVSESTSGPSTLSLKLYQPQTTSTSNPYGQALEIDSKLMYLSSNVHTTPHLLQLTSVVDEASTLFTLKILTKDSTSQPDWSTVPSSSTWTWNPPSSGNYDREFTHAILSAWNTAITYRNYLLSPPEMSASDQTDTDTVPTTRYRWHEDTPFTTDVNGGGGIASATMSINQNLNAGLTLGFTSSATNALSSAIPDYRIYLNPAGPDPSVTPGSIQIQKGNGTPTTNAPRNAILSTIGQPNTTLEVGYSADINRQTRTFFLFVNRTSTDPLTADDAVTADWTYTESGVVDNTPLRHIGFQSIGAVATVTDVALVGLDGPEPPPVDTTAPTASVVEAGSILWGGTDMQALSIPLDGSGGGQIITEVTFTPEAGQTVEATVALTDTPTSSITEDTEPTYLIVVTPPTETETQSSVSLFKGNVLIEGTETGHADLNGTPSHIWVRYLKRDSQNEFYVGFGNTVDFAGTVWRGIDTDVATTPSMLHFGLGTQGTGGAANPGIGTVAYDAITVTPKPELTSITTNYDEVIWSVQGEITPLTKQLKATTGEYLGGMFEASMTLDNSVLGQEFVISLTANNESDLGKLADYKLTLYPNSGEAGLERRTDDTWNIVEGTYKSSSKISGLTSVTGAPHKLWFLYMPLWNSREFMLGVWHATDTEPARTEPLWKWAQDNAILRWSEPITPYSEDDPDTALPSLKQFGVSSPAVSIALNNVAITPLEAVDTDRIAEQQANATAATETEKRGTITEDGLPALSLWQNATSVYRIQAQSGAPGQRTIMVSGQPEDRVILAFTKDAPGLTGAYVEEPEIAFRLIFSGADRPESTYWPTRGLAITSENSLADNQTEQLRPEGRSYNIQLSEGEISVYSTINPDLGYVWWNDDVLEYSTANGYTFGPWYFTVGTTQGALATLSGDDGGSYVVTDSTSARSMATPQSTAVVRRYA